MKKLTFAAAALIAMQTPASAESPFCIEAATDLSIPAVLAERPGKVTIRDSGAAFWLTTDPISMSVEANFYDTKTKVVAFWDAGQPSLQDFKSLCRKIATTCSVRVTDDEHTVIVEDSFEHMGSAIHRMNYYTPQSAFKVRAIAPPKERGWLKPAISDLINAIEADVFAPC